MKLKHKLQEFTAQKRGLLATNFYNLETLQGVLKAASAMDEPVILQLTKSSIDYMGLNTAVAMGRAALKEYGVEGWIHLDHGGSVELAQACLDAGFDSVMIDGSEHQQALPPPHFPDYFLNGQKKPTTWVPSLEKTAQDVSRHL